MFSHSALSLELGGSNTRLLELGGLRSRPLEFWRLKKNFFRSDINSPLRYHVKVCATLFRELSSKRAQVCVEKCCATKWNVHCAQE